MVSPANLERPPADAGLELPEQPETLTMPTQEGVRFEDEGGGLPTLRTACKEDQPEAIGLGEAWFLGLTMEDDRLLAEEGILSDEFGPGVHDLQRNAKKSGTTARAGELEESLFQGVDHGVGETH